MLEAWAGGAGRSQSGGSSPVVPDPTLEPGLAEPATMESLARPLPAAGEGHVTVKSTVAAELALDFGCKNETEVPRVLEVIVDPL